MRKRLALTLAAGISMMATDQAPASIKPCRGKDGKVVECPKPPRKPSPRCKDDKGRFVACGTASEKASPK